MWYKITFWCSETVNRIQIYKYYACIYIYQIYKYYACIVFMQSEFEYDLLECNWILSLFSFATGCRADVLSLSSFSFLTYCVDRTPEAQHTHYCSYRIFQLFITSMGGFPEEKLSLFHHCIWHRIDLSPNQLFDYFYCSFIVKENHYCTCFRTGMWYS